jgi:hypothetical protein
MSNRPSREIKLSRQVEGLRRNLKDRDATIATLRAELEEARETIEKLPLTEDGKRIVPGMLLYSQTMTPQRVPDGGVGISFAAVDDTDDPEYAQEQAEGGYVIEGMFSSEAALRDFLARTANGEGE